MFQLTRLVTKEVNENLSWHVLRLCTYKIAFFINKNDFSCFFMVCEGQTWHMEIGEFRIPGRTGSSCLLLHQCEAKAGEILTAASDPRGQCA